MTSQRLPRGGFVLVFATSIVVDGSARAQGKSKTAAHLLPERAFIMSYDLQR